MRSQAQKQADKKYRLKQLNNGTKKQINATLNIDDYNLIDEYCKANNVSKGNLIVKACKYVINNGINLDDIDQLNRFNKITARRSEYLVN